MRFSRALRKRLVDAYAAAHGGRFDPAGFVAEAAAHDHPAHDWFEWNDTAAAAEYRVAQARAFVSYLRVKFTIETVGRQGAIKVIEESFPAYVSPMDARQSGGGYVGISPNDPAALALLAEEGAMVLASWLRRYGGAASMLGVQTAPIERTAAALNAARLTKAAAA